MVAVDRGVGNSLRLLSLDEQVVVSVHLMREVALGVEVAVTLDGDDCCSLNVDALISHDHREVVADDLRHSRTIGSNLVVCAGSVRFLDAL